MASVALTDFASQQAEVERRRRMAELLQQQAAAPIEVQSSHGTPAPIPWTATLGKVLQSYAGAKLQRDALKEERAVRQQARDEAGRFMKEQAVDPGITLNEGLADPATLSTKGPGILDRLKGAFQGQPQPAAPMPPPQGPPASPQALGAALGGSLPPQAPQAAPPVQPVQQAPLPPAGGPDPKALGAILAGTPQAATTVSPEPVPERAPVQPFDPRRPRPMAEQQERLLEASMSGNPYLERLAPALYEHNQARGDKVEDLDYAVRAKTAEQDRAFRDKALLQQMKPEERTALQKDFEFAKNGGYKGSFMDWVAYAQPKFVSTSPGQPLFDARDLHGNGNGAPGVTKEQLTDFVTTNFPGAKISSGLRTPAQNAAAGGVANSAHLDDRARDFQYFKPDGSPDLARMEAEAKAFGASAPPGLKMIYEGPGAAHSTGPHLHLEMTDTGGHGAQPVAIGPARPVPEGAIIDADTLKFMASQAIAGDRSVFTNLGRGAQGAGNIAALRKEVMTQARAANLSGADMAQLNAGFMGAMSEARAVGSRAGAADVAAVEVPRMASMSSEAYAALPRGDFVPFNKLRRLVDHNLSSPEQAQAYTADVGLITAWARALNPQGVPRLADVERGERLLDTATSAAAHEAVVKQMLAEANAILAGTRDAKDRLKPGSQSGSPTATSGWGKATVVKH